MLCAKNLKAVKAALIMILGVGGFTSAHAAFNLTSTPTLSGHDVAVYAAETIATGAASGVARTTVLHASADRMDFTASATLSFPLTATGTTYYARYDLVAPDGVAAKFVGLAADDFSGTGGAGPTNPRAFDVDDGSTVVYAFDGAPGDGTTGDTVFSLDMNGEPPENDPTTPEVDESVTLLGHPRAAKVQVGGATGGDYKVELRFRIYDNIPGAISGVGATYIDAMKPIVAVDNTLSVTAAAADAPSTADVAAGFKMFAGASPKSATLGNVYISVKRVHDPDGGGAHAGWMIRNANDGMPVTPTSVMASGSAVVTGDFSAGTFTLGGAAAALKDANGKDLEKYTEGDNKGKVMNPGLAATATFAISPSGALAEHANAASTHVVAKPFVLNVDKNETPIPVGSYSATTSAKAAGANAAAIADRTGALGAIIRNGTTVHLGYLTTYAGHNQRLTIVNRGPLDVIYEVQDIVTEMGTMAEEGPMATGEIGPKSSVSVQVRDVISFSDDSMSTRASATLTLTAKPSDISVSTNLINTMDRSTDTVVHH